MAALKTPPPKSSLMDILWDIQKKRRYIASDDMTKIANEFNISRTELEGIITFYHFYHRSHAGNYTIYLNNSIISKQRNFAAVKRAFEKELGISVGETTDDKLFGLFETSCIGLSDQETSALINFQAFTDLTPLKVKNIIGQLKKGATPESLSSIPKNNIQYTPNADKTIFFKPYTPGVALKKLKKLTPVQLIELVKKSKLSGRGGAFFPTGMKWEFCKNNISDQKYIICNADEGEPGTFKDRVLMNKYPGLMLEGMSIAGYAVGATIGYVYLRAEYFYLKEKIEKEIQVFRTKGLLGKNILGIPGFEFDIHIHMGAGAYVCGEETALISSMEGKRGEPSTKEYFPVEKGLFGKPTIINNVETLCAVPRILNMSLDKYVKIGTEATKGTKLLSVSGDCKKPGIYEIEWGMKLKHFLKLIEAENPYMVLFNGYAGECLSEADFDREISGENLLAEHVQFKWEDPIEYARKMSAIGLRSGGSFMVFNDQRDLMSIFENITDFFVSESCGICSPCRTGNFLLTKKLKKIKLCHAENSDLEDLEKWSTIIKQSSRCGLGKTSTNYLLTAMLKFPQEFKKCILAKSDFNKSFDLEKVTEEYNTIINEIEKSMDKKIHINIDGNDYQVLENKKLVDAAKENGIYIPTLCHFREVEPSLGTCRICTVVVNGKFTTSCTTKVKEGMTVEINTPELIDTRKAIIEMLFAEGNHFCPSCEKSGNCDLQNLAYDMGITFSRFPHVFSNKYVDFNPKRMIMDANRCILCKRCVEEIQTTDSMDVFSFVNRGVKTRVHIDYEQEEKLSEAEALHAMNLCPVGAILVKGMIYKQPFGDRKYDILGKTKQTTPGDSCAYNYEDEKFIVATTSLAGCFGCHMSLLDIDEEIIDLLEIVEFNKSPLTDIKNFSKRCHIGLIEGGISNSENVEVLKEFRKKCDILIAFGECSVMGGIPAMRNFFSLKDCLEEAYIHGVTSEIGANTIPNHEDIPKLLNNVYPCNEVVKIDHFIPGCPPNANHIWKVVKSILLGKEFPVMHEEFKYD